MILPINTRYRLAANRHSWVVQKRRKRKDRKTGVYVEDWKSILWFASLDHALNALTELMLRTSEAKTLADALAEVKKVTATLSQALAPKFIVTLAEALPDEENVEASLSQADAQEKEAAG